MAISSPLLETTIEGATGVIINITGSADIGLDEVDTAAQKIIESVDPDANIIWGAAFNNDLDDEMIITVIATGFDSDKRVMVEETVASKPAVTFETSDEISDEADVADEEDFTSSLMKFFKSKSDEE